jgi:hypothetical protein
LVPIALFDGNVREAVVEAVTLAGDGRWDLPTEKAEEDLGVKRNNDPHNQKSTTPASYLLTDILLLSTKS